MLTIWRRSPYPCMFLISLHVLRYVSCGISVGRVINSLTISKFRQCFPSLKPWHDDFLVEERLVWLEVEGVPIHAWDNAVFRSICNKWGDMLFSDDSDTRDDSDCDDENYMDTHAQVDKIGDEKYYHPPGFSTKMQQDHAPVVRSLNDSLASDSNSLGGSHKSVGFSLVERLEETIKGRLRGFWEKVEVQGRDLNKRRWVRDLCNKHKVNFLALQETKIVHVDLWVLHQVWGNNHFDFASTSARAIEGDFNEVREAGERFRSSYNERQAGLFNNFISNASLIDVPLGGYKFTWTDKWGSKMSKIDRFLVSELFYETFPNISGVILEKGIPDHRPILIKDYVVDFGPTPFWFFHSWFEIEGFHSMVVDTWKNDGIVEANGLISFKKKLQNLKRVIREWVSLQRSISLTLKKDHLMRLSSVDTKIDQGLASEMDLCDRRESIRILGDLDKREASDIAQKSRIK
ncbi:RNA-directed DNA polymerase, eukaryota, reverse transcriptase zinc-binding domain protein [Tanacetum coccineum]